MSLTPYLCSVHTHATLCDGKSTLVHAMVRELVFYIPLMFLLDKLFGEVGLAAALVVGEAFGAAFALLLLYRAMRKQGIGKPLSKNA